MRQTKEEKAADRLHHKACLHSIDVWELGYDLGRKGWSLSWPNIRSIVRREYGVDLRGLSPFLRGLLDEGWDHGNEAAAERLTDGQRAFLGSVFEGCSINWQDLAG